MQGKLEVALNVVSTLKLARAEINVFHYGALLSACSRAGSWQLALDLYKVP